MTFLLGRVPRLGLVAVWPLVFVGCGKTSDPWAHVKGGPPRVLVSFPALECFAQNVAGNEAGVLAVLSHVGPHEYKPTAADALKFRKADLFFYNGLDLDDFLLQLAKSSGNAKLVSVNLGTALPKKELLAMKEHDHSEAGGGHHHHGEHDPHVWLGIPEAIQMVRAICKHLQELPGTSADKQAEYGKRAETYVTELEKLQEYGQHAFKDKKNKKLITMHESLSYFARTFGLDIVGSIQLQPNMEATSERLAKLVEQCGKEGVAVLAVEPQYPASAAELLQKELRNRGADVAVVLVDPLETAGVTVTPSFYVSKMKANIDALATKLP